MLINVSYAGGFYLYVSITCYDGLSLKHGNDISAGAGMLGANSPFKNILILGWLL